MPVVTYHLGTGYNFMPVYIMHFLPEMPVNNKYIPNSYQAVPEKHSRKIPHRNKNILFK